MGAEIVQESILNKSFDAFWPELEARLNTIHKEMTETLKPPLGDTDKINEILNIVREHSRLLFELTHGEIMSDNRRIIISLVPLGLRQIFTVDISKLSDFNQLTDVVFGHIRTFVRPYTYNYEWILKDIYSEKSFDHLRKLKNFGPGKHVSDDRSLVEVGIIGGMSLEVRLLDPNGNMREARTTD